MKYVFHPDALTEYAEAVNYYAAQTVATAQALISAIEAAIYRIREAPTRYPVIMDQVRRCRVEAFPYAVLHPIEPDYILILVIMHCSRKPDHWKSRQ